MPLHPTIVHFPVALSFLLPILVIVFTWSIRRGKMSREMWLVIIGLQALITISGYIALETGETDEDRVATVVGKKLIHEHEEAAEIFVGFTVVSLASGIVVWFLSGTLQEKARLVVIFLSLLPVYFVWQTSHLGGQIIYVHNGASAHAEPLEVFEVETTVMRPAETLNESLKPDENDYSGENFLEDDSARAQD